VEVGDREVLLGDSLVLHQRAISEGASVDLHVTSGAFHMWQEWTPWLPEAEESLQRAAAFLKNLLEEV
jgi:acetyl esterase/lipase